MKPLFIYRIEGENKVPSYTKYFYNDGECRAWIIATLDLSKDWTMKQVRQSRYPITTTA